MKVMIWSFTLIASLLFYGGTPQAGSTNSGAIPMSDTSPEGNWIITEVEGLEIHGADLRLEISGGAVFGQAPCNSFTAALISDDGQFSLGPLDLRGNVCDESTMADEQTYMRLLSRLSHFEVEGGNTLVLSSFGQPKIRARREG